MIARLYVSDDAVRMKFVLAAQLVGTSLAAVCSRSRGQRLAYKRFMVCYLMRAGTNLSFIAIGDLVNRDHSTVLHGVNYIKRQIAHSHELKRHIDTMVKRMRDAGNPPELYREVIKGREYVGTMA